VVSHKYAASALHPTTAIPYPGAMRSAANGSTNASTDRLATVVEAAEILGITPDAVRSRLRRDTLKRSSKRGEDGAVLVVMPAPKNADQSGNQSETVSDQSTDQSVDQSATDRDASPTVALVERMASEIDWLRREVERKDTIIMQMAQRIPELEAPSGPRESRETSAEGKGSLDDVPHDQERRSWWRRIFEG
jgi:hypothetical protein